MTTNDKTRLRFRTPNFQRASTVALGVLCFTAQVCLLVNTALSSSGDDASKAAGELEQMRYAGKPTLYDDAERRTAELLKQFTDPKD